MYHFTNIFIFFQSTTYDVCSIFTDWQIIQCAEKQGINRVTSAKKSNLVLIFLFHK